jgi:hypothetical protein
MTRSNLTRVAARHMRTNTQFLPVMAGNSNGLVLVSDQLFSSTQEDELAEFDGSQSLPLVSN